MAEEIKDPTQATETGDDDQKKQSEKDPGDGGQNKEPEKSFTQEELDAIVKDRLARERKGLPTKEELKAFKEWQEKQKTESEKTAEQLKELESLRAQAKNYEYREKARDANVQPKFLKFVVSEVTEDLGDGDFDAALKTYLSKNPEFVATQEKPPGATGQRQGSSAGTKSDEQAYLDAKYGKNPYYTKKE